MNTRSGLIASVAGASLFLGVADVCAAPSTFFMEGTTAFYLDFSNGPVPSNAGLPFSVTVNLDLANGTPVTSTVSPNLFSYRFSESGCPLVVNGTCEGHKGAQLPVVTHYSVLSSFAPSGGYVPVPASADFWDQSSRLNQSLTGVNPMDTYAIDRSQQQCVVTGDPEGVYQQSCTSHVLTIDLVTHDNTMFGSLANLLDLNGTANFTNVPPGSLSFTYTTSTRIDNCMKDPEQGPVCEFVADLPGSATWSGTLTAVVPVVQGPTSKEACKKNGWKAFGFKNQGQCVSYVNHLP
jgi:hypothetical protein